MSDVDEPGNEPMKVPGSEPRTERQAERRGSARRRAGRRPVLDDTVPSPCITVCQVDDESGCCIGCFRSIDEIREWPILSADEKRAVLARIAERKAATAGRPPDE